ncbi:MAG: hypothetical protein AB3K77_02210 [Methanosarcinaceae archaeon]
MQQLILFIKSVVGASSKKSMNLAEFHNSPKTLGETHKIYYEVDLLFSDISWKVELLIQGIGQNGHRNV